MMGLGEIRRLSREATRRSKRKGADPWRPSTDQRARLAAGATLDDVGARLPFLGDYVPKGWKLSGHEPLFVDMSGFGASNEPALTLKQLAEQVGADPEGFGYGLVEHGQFQGYVARYELKPARKPREYKGVLITPAGRNSSGIRWHAFGKSGQLRADTLSGIKELIKQETQTNA